MTTPSDDYSLGVAVAKTQQALALVWVTDGPEHVWTTLDNMSTQDLKHLIMMSTAVQAERLARYTPAPTES